MSKQSRNAPCPCGSGKKYKNCHLAADEAAARHGEPPASGGPAHPAPRRLVYTVLAVGVALSIGVAVVRDLWSGLVVLAAWCLGVGAWLSFRDPPPPNEDPGNPAGLDFGRRE